MPVEDLPVSAVLPELVEALTGHGAAVLVSPPGTGKTTLVPLALRNAVRGRVVVAEPRRVAARAAARRMASLVGDAVGATVGYTVRGDRKVAPSTRVEVVTTGVLVRRLQHDPELPGVDAVVLDECHERHLDTDLALAFLVDVRAALRPDLLVLATSATAEADRLSALLAGPVVVAPSALHEVTTVWAPPPRPVAPPQGLRVDPKLLDHVATTVRRALTETEGDVLVFLPGVGEINAVANRLGGVTVEVLHGRLPAAAQDAVLRPAGHRRVVLATSVAESSLTVPGVRVVVDAGLAREPRTDHARGLGSLVTVRASRATGTQRAGRAGREAPGVVYRCWNAADRLPDQPQPEVAVADLTGFALDLACWGYPDGTGLALPDPPPAGAMQVARTTLEALGAVDATGRVTDRGRRIAAVGAHPRLARALLDGAGLVGERRVAELVALLSDDSLPTGGDDLVAGWRRLRATSGGPWHDEVRRLRSTMPPTTAGPPPTAAGPPPTAARAARAAAAGTAPSTVAGRSSPAGSGAAPSSAIGHVPDDLAAGMVVGLAFPERLARLRRAGGSTYLMAGGTAAELSAGSALTGLAWLAVATADRQPGNAAARVRLAAAVDEATARTVGSSLVSTVDEVTWAGDELVARRAERLGAILLTERPLPNPTRALVTAALHDRLRREGLGLLRWTPAARALRDRMAFCHHVFGDPWPDMSDEALLAAAPSWVDASRLSKVDVHDGLRRLLPWPAAARLDELAPERLQIPSGTWARVDYTDPTAPTLSVKVQEAFGWKRAPTVGDGRVPVVLHLLSPASRPVAVTADLASFWQTGYPRVRAELRGRYPRHPWPEDPTTAPPTRRTNPRR